MPLAFFGFILSIKLNTYHNYFTLNTEGYKLYHSYLTPTKTSHLLDIHHVLAVHPDHEVAHFSRLESCWYDDIVASRQLEPCEDFPVVDVRSGGPAVVVVHEVRGLQSLGRVHCAVETETYLQHPHLERERGNQK